VLLEAEPVGIQSYYWFQCCLVEWNPTYVYFLCVEEENNKLIYICITSHHSTAEHRASTRILHLTLFLASVLTSIQVFLTLFVSSSTAVRHVFLGLPLPRLPCGFHSRACLAISSDGLRIVWPSHPHSHFLICESILGCFVRFHNSPFVIWSSQKILNIFLSHFALPLP